jgi:acetyltransferase-like isoleucine patch superfamily enzyme
MIFSHIQLGQNVQIDPSTSVNNVIIGDNVKIAKLCSIFGVLEHPLIIGGDSYIGMLTILNGFACQLKIGNRVSIAQRVNIMTDSGPNASPALQQIFPIESKPVTISDDCWIGANCIILPGVTLGRFCVVAANSCVKSSFPPFTIIGGNPAKLIRTFTPEEITKLNKE